MNFDICRLPMYICAKVLPTAYDDSLSYYENLCKLTEKMNEIITVMNDSFETMVREQINKYFVASVYESSTETLVLSLNEKGI